ncbi:MAG: hypothetical protein JW932_15115 [Deltaproteobacteria bacterium]|nr:hypothetical protein [Deltaproteobacteria bacterium]
MSNIQKQIIVLILLLYGLVGCTPGLYTRMDSTAPTFGPLYMGMTRQDAERHVGIPIFKIPVDKTHYKNIYEYEEERGALYTASTDIADILSLGLTSLMISPIDRFNGKRHLIAVVFEIRDSYAENDRITRILDKI